MLRRKINETTTTARTATNRIQFSSHIYTGIYIFPKGHLDSIGGTWVQILYNVAEEHRADPGCADELRGPFGEEVLALPSPFHTLASYSLKSSLFSRLLINERTQH